MPKFLKIAICVFVAADIFVFAYFGLAQLRLNMFGQGAIPGGGSALDMALFLLPLFLAYVAADRLYHFLSYKGRQTAPQQITTEEVGSVWEDEPKAGNW